MPHPGGPGRKCWSLSELLGQRRLLGFGALLAWLVLFHLLVNVWLLCIFTSLLVVLGGWLGSRVALDANSLLHLEHFVPLGRVLPALPSPENEWRLDHEIRSTVHKAIRDFVSSWYRTLLSEEEGEFEHEVEDATLASVMELKERARCVDRKALLQRALELCGCHLQSYITARERQAEAEQLWGESASLWELYRQADAPHPALSSAATELSYARAVVNLFLHAVVPLPHLETRTGRHMVGELVTCNVLLPLVDRVSDPDWLNLTIVEIFAKSREPAENNVAELPRTLYRSQTQHESWTTCCSSSSEQQDPRSQSQSDETAVPSAAGAHEWHRQSRGWKEDAVPGGAVSLLSADRGEGCSLGLIAPCRPDCFYPRTDSDPESPSSPESKKLAVDMEPLIQMDSEEDQADGFCECPSPASFCSAVADLDDEPLGCFGPLRSLGPKVLASEEPHWPAGMADDLPPACAPRGLCLTPFSFEPPLSPDGPVAIQNLRITGTLTAKEHRGTSTHPYTLYTVKYETVADTESLGTLQPVSCRMVNRRYSEFLNLQTRLEERPELRKMIKNIKGPKKLFPDLPFGNADIDKVEARKAQLDTFLKQLSVIPETANSEEMLEFLALNTDASSTFEKKPIAMSRIDKMVVNALDTLKTAFPRSDPLTPTDDLEGDPDGRAHTDSRKPRSRLRFSSKIAPALNIPDLQPKVTYSFSEGSTVFNGLSLSGLEMYVTKQEQLQSWPPGTVPGQVKRASELPGKDGKGGGAWERKARGTDTAVADVALNILCLLMKDQWSWLCTENIQKTIRLLFGTFIERWLDVGVAHLTSAPCWVIYLQVMQEAVWPGGTLPAQPRPDRSHAQKEETRQQCLNCLMQLLPELITDMLGAEKYRLSLETVLQSLQDPHINKHLVYCICDLLLEFLIPESSEEGFQWSLLHSLSGEVERVSASA